VGTGIRAVVVDLDDTLYEGVLGEDEPAGVRLGPGHHEIARSLLDLHDRGVFLGVLSRNEPGDVEDLFAGRDDLLLRREHFSVVSASWGPKSEGLRDLIDRLRIGADTVLVVDDNPGELAALAAQIPGVQCLWADSSDPSATARALRHYPGLARLRKTREDGLRLEDLAAGQQREAEQRTWADPGSYLRSLEVVVTLALDAPNRVARIAELSAKTNQFNTTLGRLSEVELSRRLVDPKFRLVAGALRDRLSESGTVFGLAAHSDGECVVVDDLTLSCRALGRGIETPVVLAALSRVVAELGATSVIFPFTTGPRNEPARRWLADLSGEDPALDGAVTMTWDEMATRILAGAALAIEWESPG
jgi:FkbH-like protein